MRTISIILGLLLVTSVQAKPLEKPAGPRLNEPMIIVTNVEPESREYITLQTALLELNSYLLDPLLVLHSKRIPTHHIFNPLIEGVIYLSNNILIDVLDLFRPGLLGFVAAQTHPLRPDDLVNPTAVIDKDLSDDMLMDVTLHEMFHFIGVPHVGDPDELMFPFYSPESERKVGILTLAELYTRYELKPKYAKQVLDWAKEQMDKHGEVPESKVPKHDEVGKHTCGNGGHRVQF